MDCGGWTVVALVAVLLWRSATFRVAVGWGLLALVLLAVPVTLVYPDVWNAVPGILDALWQP